MKRLFTKLSGREQSLLLLFIWTALLWWAGTALFSSHEQAAEECPAFYVTADDGQPHFYPAPNTADWVLPEGAIEFPSGLDIDGPRGLVAKLQKYDQHSDAIHGHNQILSERENIEKAIRERLKSHDNSFTKGKLENIADKVAKAIDPTGTRYAEVKPRDLGSLFSQHSVEITFKKANWDNLKAYVSKIREFSPGMFLSEVEIEPHYRTGPDGPYVQDYEAIFHVSSLELKKKRF